MGVFAGQGDPAWSMAMLWRPPSTGPARTGPGPKPALSLDAIVRAAIEVADRDGLAGLSMRAVGERLGRTAMALYTYVPGKEELLDLMYDGAHAELPGGYGPGEGWRAGIGRWAADLGAFYLRHPWTLQVSHSRPALGPHEQGVVENLVGILRETGLPATALRRIVGVLIHFVRGTAQTIAEARLAATATGVSDEEWWSARSAQLHQVVPDFNARFPMSAWLGEEGLREEGLREDGPGEKGLRESGLGEDGLRERAASGTGPDEGCDEDASVPYLEREARAMIETGLAVLLDGIEAATLRASRRARP
ncbi:TetR/AcrR family transcriptional regulator [Rugosimonospora africana]|uniref:TetR family transcriptional regulator n=1 Tax=Rugosimonospora africana TaxID=556532 RepID=A0A8J3QQ42_9ACTN|nr:TetR/AcrR family transcriptional regulator [Rugosimonospora africana]GIH14449.1 TetR family transcriptional regulator [Rugosimonospora africana]